ncbi:dual specificity protein phosphatase [Paludisphaera sp.]|uniref:dual specificity protein phosphatase family protein n=1 Tax=Paludisphaera sp. TaxID=2017432 RepID=UPI00301C1770
MDVRLRVFPITRSLWLGPFASPMRRPVLVASRVTHILNVGEAPSVLSTSDTPFREIAWLPIEDMERIPDDIAITCLGALHRMVCQPDARVYIHCIAGQNRSPTILWLYLIGCGLDVDRARAVIEAGARDAIPGHNRLVDDALVEVVRRFGGSSLLPHPRPEALEPLVATEAALDPGQGGRFAVHLD